MSKPKSSAKSKRSTPTKGPVAGIAVFIRTVTMYYTGRIASIDAEQIILDDAAWIADTGRFAAFLQTGTPNEVEPFPSWVAIPRGCVVDITPWPHALPRAVK